MEPHRDSRSLPQSKPAGNADDDDDRQKQEEENEIKVKSLKQLIVESQQHPDPTTLHTLASILENSVSRSSQNVERLCELIWGDKEFSRISTSFLTVHSISVQVAAARLFSICLPWVSRDVLQDDALDNLRDWVRNEIPRSLADDRDWTHETGRRKDLDWEMLSTYYTGLLAGMLARGDEKLKEQVLAFSLPSKIMRYLRLRVSVSGETVSTMVCPETGEGSRTRLHNVTESSHFSEKLTRKRDRDSDLLSLDETERDPKRYVSRQACGDDLLVDEKALADSLAKLREKFCFQCLVILQNHDEVRHFLLQEDGFKATLTVLLRSIEQKEAVSTKCVLRGILKLIHTLIGRKNFAKLFVEHHGIQILLSIPRSAVTFGGLSMCLLKIGSIEGMMGCVCACARPSDVDQVVKLALQLLECQHSESRKNAASFFTRAFVFRAVINAFDARCGLQKLLILLHDRSVSESEKEMARVTCKALERYFRAQLLLLVDLVRPTISTHISSVRSAHEALDIGDQAMDVVSLQIQKDRELGLAFARDGGWPVVDRFLGARGHITMLELCQAPKSDIQLYYLLEHALGVLHIVTLVPNSHKLIINATLSNSRHSVDVILRAAYRAQYFDSEISVPALKLLANLVCPPSISDESSSTLQSQVREAREAVRANDGIKVFLKLLGPKKVGCAGFDQIWALSCRALIGLATDNRVADTLRKLDVEKKLRELIRDPASQIPSGEWQEERVRMTKELLKVVTNSVAISDESRESLLNIHQFLEESGFTHSADKLLKEAGLTPRPCDTEKATLDDLFEDVLKKEYSNTSSE